MNEEQIYEQFEKDVQELARKYSANRIQISTLNFDRDFKLGQDDQLHLVSTKAVIRALGKTSKVPIGKGCEFATYAEAEKATREHWSEYFKRIRTGRSESEKKAEARRQKRYREKRKAEEQARIQRG